MTRSHYAVRGYWTIRVPWRADTSTIELNYHAKNVYLVVGGEGTVTVLSDGRTQEIPISGAPTSHQIVAGDQAARGNLEVRLSAGLQAFSFTYG
jgi:hypothetical protein